MRTAQRGKRGQRCRCAKRNQFLTMEARQILTYDCGLPYVVVFTPNEWKKMKVLPFFCPERTNSIREDMRSGDCWISVYSPTTHGGKSVYVWIAGACAFTRLKKQLEFNLGMYGWAEGYEFMVQLANYDVREGYAECEHIHDKDKMCLKEAEELSKALLKGS